MWCKYNYFFLKKSAFCCFFFNISRSVQTGFIVRGSSPDQNITEEVVIGVGMQNASQAIAIASSPFIFANEEMAIPAILYSLMMNIVLLTYVFIIRQKAGR